MFVGDVYRARTPSAETLSDGSPVAGLSIRSKERHVSAAYPCSVFAGDLAAAGSASTRAAASMANGVRRLSMKDPRSLVSGPGVAPRLGCGETPGRQTERSATVTTWPVRA